MNEYSLGAIYEPTRARIRIQIKSTRDERIRGNRDKMLIAKSYNILELHDGTFALQWTDQRGILNATTLESGQYIETKLMG